MAGTGAPAAGIAVGHQVSWPRGLGRPPRGLSCHRLSRDPWACHLVRQWPALVGKPRSFVRKCSFPARLSFGAAPPGAQNKPNIRRCAPSGGWDHPEPPWACVMGGPTADLHSGGLFLGSVLLPSPFGRNCQFKDSAFSSWAVRCFN